MRLPARMITYWMLWTMTFQEMWPDLLLPDLLKLFLPMKVPIRWRSVIHKILIMTCSFRKTYFLWCMSWIWLSFELTLNRMFDLKQLKNEIVELQKQLHAISKERDQAVTERNQVSFFNYNVKALIVCPTQQRPRHELWMCSVFCHPFTCFARPNEFNRR